MGQSPILGRDFFLKLFPMDEWDGSDDHGLRLIVVNGQDGVYCKSLFEDEFSSLRSKATPEEKACLADLEKHPRGNICEPALPIPFSIKQLKEFLQCYGEIFEKFVLNDGFLTIPEVAHYLKVPQIEVFRNFQMGNETPNLAPSVLFSNPIKVTEIEGDGTVQEIDGLLEIDGIRGLFWTISDVSGVNLFHQYEPSEEPWGAPYQPYWLRRRQFMLAPTNGENIGTLSFNRSDLVVSHLALLEYLEAYEREANAKEALSRKSEKPIAAEQDEKVEEKLRKIVVECFWSVSPVKGQRY